MSFSIEFADDQSGYDARIKVIGCGGSGGNAVNNMIRSALEGCDFVAANTDAQALANSLAPGKRSRTPRGSTFVPPPLTPLVCKGPGVQVFRGGAFRRTARGGCSRREPLSGPAVLAL